MICFAERNLLLKIDFEGKRARGITFLKDGTVRRVRADKEVILSAGALRTPQLLMLSGIGAREHLESFKVGAKAKISRFSRFLLVASSVILDSGSD